MQPPRPPPLPMNHLSNMENGGYNPKLMKSTRILFTLNILHNLTQICLGGIIVSAVVLVNLMWMTEPLAKHIVLCITGYFILMVQAILLFSPVGWANNLNYASKKQIHFTMHILGCLLAICGGAIAINKTRWHFESSHAICGFIAFFLTVVSLVGGILNLIFRHKWNTKAMDILHSCFASMTMFMAFVSLILAFHLYYRITAGDGNANFTIVLTFYALVGTLLMASVDNLTHILGE